MVGSETGLLAAEVPAPVELSRAPGHVPVSVARAVTPVGWATIIIATLIHRPAPLLIVASGMATPLVEADQTAKGSPLPAMPACNMSGDRTA
jgi:hypothetical protein